MFECTTIIIWSFMLQGVNVSFFQSASGLCGPGWQIGSVAYVDVNLRQPLWSYVVNHEVCHAKRYNAGYWRDRNLLERVREEAFCHKEALRKMVKTR